MPPDHFVDASTAGPRPARWTSGRSGRPGPIRHPGVASVLCRSLLAWCRAALGQFTDAVSTAEEGVTPRNRAAVQPEQRTLGWLEYPFKGEFPEAVSWLEEALALSRTAKIEVFPNCGGRIPGPRFRCARGAPVRRCALREGCLGGLAPFNAGGSGAGSGSGRYICSPALLMKRNGWSGRRRVLSAKAGAGRRSRGLVPARRHRAGGSPAGSRRLPRRATVSSPLAADPTSPPRRPLPPRPRPALPAHRRPGEGPRAPSPTASTIPREMGMTFCARSRPIAELRGVEPSRETPHLVTLRLGPPRRAARRRGAGRREGAAHQLPLRLPLGGASPSGLCSSLERGPVDGRTITLVYP